MSTSSVPPVKSSPTHLWLRAISVRTHAPRPGSFMAAALMHESCTWLSRGFDQSFWYPVLVGKLVVLGHNMSSTP
eukprot:5050455-Pleurochrysis_carterae.AAC.1